MILVKKSLEQLLKKKIIKSFSSKILAKEKLITAVIDVDNKVYRYVCSFDDFDNYFKRHIKNKIKFHNYKKIMKCNYSLRNLLQQLLQCQIIKYSDCVTFELNKGLLNK